MKIKYLLPLLAIALIGAPTLTRVQAKDEDAPAAKDADTDAKTIVIVANNNLKFSVTHIDAKPGERLHIQLRNEGTLPKASMGHNWVLLKAGSDAVKYASAALASQKNGYMPVKLQDEVIASIPLLGPKEVGDVTFEAPTEPGTYPFICSCSDHSLAGMKGELVVK